ncbi:MAG: GMC family oxidoreductase [Actinobacteria bacterium]|nr:GMC family oxidoreductase [Actinomycetota bacterium]
MSWKVSGPRRLSSLERETLAKLVDALLPSSPTLLLQPQSLLPGGLDMPGGLDIGVPSEIESWISKFTPVARKIVRAMLLGFDLTPLLSRQMSLFHSLDTDQAKRWVDQSRYSKFSLRRQALAGLETLIQLAYASSPSVCAAIGWDGLPLLPLDYDQIPPSVKVATISYPDLSSETVTADVVIVGSGAGGAVVADTLAAAGFKVVVLEEGIGYNRENFASKPPVERMLELYRDNGLTFTSGSPVISLPMGKVVGGTTVVNSGTFFRTPDEVLNSWSLSGILDITPDDMDPWFSCLEDALSVHPVPDEVFGNNGGIFQKGAETLGWSGGHIKRNIRNCHGHGVCAFGCPIDAKQAMHVTFLPKAVSNGAVIYSGVRVRKVLMQHGIASGVTAEILDNQPGVAPIVRGTLEVRAKAVVMAAGAVYTPALLLRQRLGNTSGLLGQNLVIHPGGGTTALFDEELYAWKGTMQSYYVDEKLGQGVLLEATFPPPGIGYSAGSLPTPGTEGELFRLYPNMASCGSIISDAGVGKVIPLGRYSAVIRYNITSYDTAKVLEASAMACELFLAAGAKRVYPMLPGIESVSSPKEADDIRTARIARSLLHLSAYHPMGTAKMGSDPRYSVVDSWGAVWDTPGLWIMDASILPSSTYVNPQETIMAVAMRCASKLADLL